MSRKVWKENLAKSYNYWHQAEFGKTTVCFDKWFTGITAVYSGSARVRGKENVQKWLSMHPNIAEAADNALNRRKEHLKEWRKTTRKFYYSTDRASLRLKIGDTFLDVHNNYGDICDAPVYVVPEDNWRLPPEFEFLFDIKGTATLMSYDCDGPMCQPVAKFKDPEVFIGGCGCAAIAGTVLETYAEDGQ